MVTHFTSFAFRLWIIFSYSVLLKPKETRQISSVQVEIDEQNPRGTPKSGFYGEAPPERGFFRAGGTQKEFLLCERVGETAIKLCSFLHLCLDLVLFRARKLDVEFSRVFIRYKDTH